MLLVESGERNSQRRIVFEWRGRIATPGIAALDQIACPGTASHAVGEPDLQEVVQLLVSLLEILVGHRRRQRRQRFQRPPECNDGVAVLAGPSKDGGALDHWCCP